MKLEKGKKIAGPQEPLCDPLRATRIKNKTHIQFKKNFTKTPKKREREGEGALLSSLKKREGVL